MAIKAVLFDWGGVLAEEGFRKGLEAIGEKNGIRGLFEVADELIYGTGYVTGGALEKDYWRALRQKTGIKGTDGELRAEILDRFVQRPEMFELADRLRAKGIIAAVLSDQTNWLDEMDLQRPFKHHFDYVFNSYHLKKGKRDASVFADVLEVLGVRPEEALFVDDNPENIKRARGKGLRAIHFRGLEGFEAGLQETMKS